MFIIILDYMPAPFLSTVIHFGCRVNKRTLIVIYNLTDWGKKKNTPVVSLTAD